MAPKFVFALFVCILAVGASRSGGWQPIENPNDDKVVVDVAIFAVEEYNREHNESVAFVSVVKGEQQVVAGAKYRLLIAAASGNYTAVVWFKLDKTVNLISFGKEIHTP